MAKRTIFPPRQYDTETWIVVRYDDTKKLSDIFRASQIETDDGATGLDHQFKIGEACLAPWKRAGSFPAIISIISDDKTDCLKKKLEMEKKDKQGSTKSKVKSQKNPEESQKSQESGKSKKIQDKKTNQLQARLQAAKAAADSMLHDVSVNGQTVSQSHKPNTASTSLPHLVSSATPVSAPSPVVSTSASALQPTTSTPSSAPHSVSAIPQTISTPPSTPKNAPPLTISTPSSTPHSVSAPPSTISTSSSTPHSVSAPPSTISTPSSTPHSVPAPPLTISTPPSTPKNAPPSTISSPSSTPHSVSAPPSTISTPSSTPHSVSAPPLTISTPSSTPQSVSALPPTTSTPASTPSSVSALQSIISTPVPACLTKLTNRMSALENLAAAASNVTPISNISGSEAATTETLYHSVPSTSRELTSLSPVSFSPCTNGNYFTRLLNDDCPFCVINQTKIINLQQQLDTAQNDLQHLRAKYQQALEDCNKKENVQVAEESSGYTPNKGFKIPKANHIIQPGLTPESVQPGYIQFGGEGSNVMVPAKWLGLMMAKTKMSGSSHALKKYMDGFFNPWQLQSVSAKSVNSMTGDQRELFDALHLFASKELGMSSAEYNRAIVTKAGTSRRTMHEVFPEHAVAKKQKIQKRTVKVYYFDFKQVNIRGYMMQMDSMHIGFFVFFFFLWIVL